MSSPRLILIGRVAGAFGVRGELRITTFSADPLSLLTYRELKGEDGSPALTLTAGRAAKGGIVARAREVETRDQAEAIRGLRLYIAREDLAPPEEDEFYLADLIGLEARDLAGGERGHHRILGGIRLRIEGAEARDHLLPAVRLDLLFKVPMLVERANADERNPEIAR